MSDTNTSPRPTFLFRRMSIHSEMSVQNHNIATINFNKFYKQPLSLGTIHETTENCNMTVDKATLISNPR